LMFKTCLWLGGEVSERWHRPLSRRPTERVRRCAAGRTLLVRTDGWPAYFRAIRETLRDPVHTGQGGQPQRRPWRNILVAHVIQRDKRRRVVETACRIVDGTPARV